MPLASFTATEFSKLKVRSAYYLSAWVAQCHDLDSSPNPAIAQFDKSLPGSDHECYTAHCKWARHFWTTHIVCNIPRDFPFTHSVLVWHRSYFQDFLDSRQQYHRISQAWTYHPSCPISPEALFHIGAGIMKLRLSMPQHSCVDISWPKEIWGIFKFHPFPSFDHTRSQRISFLPPRSWAIMLGSAEQMWDSTSRM